MPVKRIGYVELYVGDLNSSLDYFVDALGFTETGRSAGPGLDSVHLAQGTFRLRVSAGPATAAFVDAHGDGIADIAFVCDDVTATRDRAVSAGATLFTGGAQPVVSGFGAVRHTLLPDGPDETVPGGLIQELDHVAVCVDAATLASSVQFYLAGFGMEIYSSEYIEVGGQAMDSVVVRSPSGGVTFTILEPDSEKNAGQIDAFLERNNGAGVQHLAFLVDDIVGAVRHYRNSGVEFLSTPASYYDVLGERLGGMSEEIADLRSTSVLADRDEWGYLLQLFSRSPHERNTLFYELIQRRGARGFGSSNIRALYEAVERDRVMTE
ncbi:4-hydroxyphenylpyruvate dioxygenase [Actinoplanes italicus]|uniref:4-hydroxymandelate synthase n=1 Tax=Actinoplanes italicus TaxID=113567 RepID=A0A2T0JLX9_9ACTN|nr:VOC family protein [Actinoplanes italicus]PRX08629.1 4-hydroxymandelate synthase [Actinoplanes italicus]GIE36588.1 4-hydroxyphenylpyruvate dioxygenase [Actinoplanes italicus]